MAKSRAYSKMRPTLEDIARSYRIPDVSNYDRAFFTLSYLSANLMHTLPLLRSITSIRSPKKSDWNNFDEIVPNIFLGRLPSKGNVDIPESVGMVVSVVELHELGDNMLIDKYKSSDFKDKNIKQLLLRIQDTTANVSACDIYNTVVEMKKFLDDNPGKGVYIHCKAGRSRSAMLLTVFLAMYGDKYNIPLSDENAKKNVEDVIDFISNIRPHITIGPDQESKAREVVRESSALMFSPGQRVQPEPRITYQSSHDYLASLEAKDKIRFLPSFQKLAIYAVEIQHYYTNCQRTEHVRELFSSIIDSTDGKWYDDLQRKAGPIQKLLDADTGKPEDKAKRAEFVDNLSKDIQGLVEQQKFVEQPHRALSSPLT